MSAIEKLRRGEAVYGTMLRMIGHAAMPVLCRDAGLDLLMLDLEHGDFGIDAVCTMAVAAKSAGITIMARVSQLSKADVSRTLDCGIEGVMVPMVESVEQARQLVAWSKYAPLGRRGLGSIGGLTGFRKMGPAAAFVEEENRRTFAIAQIETPAGVEASAKIAKLEGIDALVVGPNDLALSLGVPGRLDAPVVEEHIERIRAAALEAGKAFGIHAGDAVLARWTQGMTLVLNAIDINVVAEGLTQLNQRTRRLMEAGRAAGVS